MDTLFRRCMSIQYWAVMIHIYILKCMCDHEEWYRCHSHRHLNKPPMVPYNLLPGLQTKQKCAHNSIRLKIKRFEQSYSNIIIVIIVYSSSITLKYIHFWKHKYSFVHLLSPKKKKWKEKKNEKKNTVIFLVLWRGTEGLQSEGRTDEMETIFFSPLEIDIQILYT